MSDQRVDDRRRRLRLLDTCLTELEEALEGGEQAVSGDLAMRLGRHVDAVTSGMPIVEALDLVFHEQALCQGRGEHMTVIEPPADREAPGEAAHPPPASLPDGRADRVATADYEATAARRPIGEAEARQLTDRIRRATRQVCMLLLEVHERRAWVPLGYASWDQYVQTEFSISRSRSYELLDQARVMLELRNAAGIQAVPDLSAYVALQIKTRLPQITASIRERVEETSEDHEAVEIIAELVEEHRSQAARTRQLVRERRRLAGMDADNIGNFADAIDLLVSMPPADRTVVDLIERAESPRIDIEHVESALAWLNELVAAWKRQPRRAERRRLPSMAER